jgi:hypothetical protein
MAASSRVEQPARPGPAQPLRLRRRINDLPPAELDQFRSSVERLLSRGDDRGYHFLAGMHGAPRFFGQHHTPVSLPWNRAYLWQFEQALADQGFPSGLPWWDWASANAEERSIPAPFAQATIGSRLAPPNRDRSRGL